MAALTDRRLAAPARLRVARRDRGRAQEGAEKGISQKVASLTVTEDRPARYTLYRRRISGTHNKWVEDLFGDFRTLDISRSPCVCTNTSPPRAKSTTLTRSHHSRPHTRWVRTQSRFSYNTRPSHIALHIHVHISHTIVQHTALTHRAPHLSRSSLTQHAHTLTHSRDHIEDRQFKQPACADAMTWGSRRRPRPRRGSRLGWGPYLQMRRSTLALAGGGACPRSR